MAGPGATGAVGRWGGGTRGYRGRGELGWRDQGLQGPWGGGVAGPGASVAVGSWGGGTRGYRGRGELGGGTRGYRGRGELGWRDQGLQGPWGVGVVGPGATGAPVAVGSGGDGICMTHQCSPHVEKAPPLFADFCLINTSISKETLIF